MSKVTTVVVGAGHCGLAMSRCLTDRSIDHVVLERGEVANSWRAERWDSLRLLTPNWMTRLPGYAYDGDDPDGFMTMPEVVDFISAYAKEVAAPVLSHTTVMSVAPGAGGGFVVTTDQGRWEADSVVLASGACNIADLPAVAEAVPPDVFQLTAKQYRNPAQLPDGGVLVVGAAATGIQIADELQRSGRPVTLAVGEHVRLPRRYRGADILWWMDAAGILDEGYDEIPDLTRARHLASMQLIGSPEHTTLDLNALTATGVRLVGRLAGVQDGVAQFSGSLPNVTALADLKLGRLLDNIDAWAAEHGVDAAGRPERFPATAIPEYPPLTLDLRRGEIRSILWATGFRPDYSWLHVPVLDRKGRVRHDGGICPVPGLYLLGAPFLRRRKSTLIDGAAADARFLSEHLAAHLREGRRAS
jgi:putative flavoprotein involved in K+ transport